MGFWDEDFEFNDWYAELEQNVIDTTVSNGSQTLVPSGGGVQPNVGTGTPEYSIGEKYRSALTAAQSPEEHDALVKLFEG